MSRRVCIITIVLIGAFAGGHLGADDAQPTRKLVRLVVDYGDGVQKHFTELAWRDEMTVLDAMTAAGKHPRGIQFKYRGRGATAFLTEIDDLENEGRGRNWIFSVNEKMAERSFAVVSLKPGDTILWKFGEYR